MNGKDEKTGQPPSAQSAQSAQSTSRFALDDLMACLASDPDGDDASLPKASGIIAPETARTSSASAPSSALAAALDAVLRIAEESVLDQVPEHARPAAKPPPMLAPHGPAPEQAGPGLFAQGRPGGARLPDRTPIPPPRHFAFPGPPRPAARGPVPKITAPASPPDPAKLADRTRVTDATRTPADAKNALPPRRARAPRMRDDVSTAPAPAHTRARRAADGGETRQLVNLLQELGQTLDSAEMLLGDHNPPPVAPSAPTAPPPPRRTVSLWREGAVLAVLFLALFAGLGGIVYSNSYWPAGATVEHGPVSAEQTEGPVKAPTAVETTNAPLPKMASAASVAPVAIPENSRTVDIALAPPEQSLASPKAWPTSPTGSAADRDAADARSLVARGKALLEAGDIGAARLLFEHAARRESGEAMLALAQSYDPGVLLKLDVHGIPPDVDKAMRWYQRAARHHSAEAGLTAAPNR